MIDHAEHQDPASHPDDLDQATPGSFEHVLAARMSRRSFLVAGAGSTAAALLGSVPLAACGGGDSHASERVLGFDAVKKHVADEVRIPATYDHAVLYALGDPLRAATAAFKNDGTDTDHENRAGDHHDGMEYFGLGADDRPSSSSCDRALLAINHEATTFEQLPKPMLPSHFLHPDGGTNSLPRPAAEVDKEVAVHGISVVEIRKTGGKFTCVPGSPFNRRVTALTPIEIHGPARGHALLKTRFSTDGTMTRGTLNNCGTGRTPWGTLLSGEENWCFYFTRPDGDDKRRGDKSVTALQRYGRKQGEASRHGWETAGADEKYARWINARTGTSIDGSDDYRNEMNGMGYVVELDPYDVQKPARKRTALGRFAHEGAAFSRVIAGKPLAIYQGDDSRNEYIYKWVSDATWLAADATAPDRLATGDKYLDRGRLFVARFHADGTGQWLLLSRSSQAIAEYAAYRFEDEADVCVNARLAGDAVGATKMDRPEWSAVNPANGDVYVTLTNNSHRSLETGPPPRCSVDGPNPRSYAEGKLAGNVNGHILRIAEKDGDAAATTFRWDVFLFGAKSTADASTVNLSGLVADCDFSSPDGLGFSPATGTCWIQTDDIAYTDVSNCMMLAALPGRVGDGGKVTLSYERQDGTTLAVDTYVGAKPTANTLKRFLVGAKDCEITGMCETPDGRTMFVNIQHPGELTRLADIADPSKYTSHWPANAGYGAGGAAGRPRSATIVITKRDGGRIGS